MTLPRRRSGRGAPLMRSAATATSTAGELPGASQAEAVALQTLPDSVPNPTRLRISPSMAHIRYSGLPGLTSASSQQSGSHELEATLVEAAGGHPLQVSGRAQVTLQTRVSVSQTQAH